MHTYSSKPSSKGILVPCISSCSPDQVANPGNKPQKMQSAMERQMEYTVYKKVEIEVICSTVLCKSIQMSVSLASVGFRRKAHWDSPWNRIAALFLYVDMSVPSVTISGVAIAATAGNLADEA